ncbi:histidine phosphatase family protein [Steroidobacter gossypii]|uniref:histidine phosphatase family protein n=1 Tax=Steroidobacter gossypii TaxID=2805490 RepID=UPI003899E6BF
MQRLSGWYDVELSQAGRAQAALLARRLRHENLAALYSSPLRRAADTATEIEKHTGLPVTYSAMLKEISCGELEGELLDDVRHRYREHWERNLTQQDPDFRWPGGESYSEFRARSLNGIAQIAGRHNTQCVAVVTHAGVISQILGHIHCLNPARWESFRPGPASMTVIGWHNRCATLLRFDDRTHLHAGSVMRKEHRP